MINFWEFYRDQTLVFIISVLYNHSEKKKEKKLDVFDQIAQDLEKYTQLASQDEFQDYISKKSYDIEKMTVLEWWCQEQQRRCWSRFSYIILDILLISVMSDESERIFSETCYTVSWNRV